MKKRVAYLCQLFLMAKPGLPGSPQTLRLALDKKSVDLGNMQERGRKQRNTDIRRSDATINKKKTV